MITQEFNLVNLIARFGGSDDKCRQYLEAIRWPAGPKCPRCGTPAKKIADRCQHRCTIGACGYHFSVTAETIFNDSHLPLWKWFLAVYMMVASKKGMSANQIKRTLKISYKTAWYLCHRVRKAMQEANRELLSGTFECDESYIGGKHRHVGSGNLDNTTMVLGAIQGGGDVCLRVEKRKKATRAILHQSLFNRSIVGSYHQISVKHLDAYLDEMEWRFNGRDNQHLFHDTMLRLLNAPKMEFKELIEKSA